MQRWIQGLVVASVTIVLGGLGAGLSSESDKNAVLFWSVLGAFGGATIAPQIAPVIARQLQRNRHFEACANNKTKVLPSPTLPEPSTSREPSSPPVPQKSSPAPSPSSNGAAENRQRDAIEWFAAKGISIKPSQQQKSGLTEIFFEHAERIGQAYIKHRDSSIVANFLRHMRWAITNRKSIRFVFKKKCFSK